LTLCFVYFVFEFEYAKATPFVESGMLIENNGHCEMTLG